MTYAPTTSAMPLDQRQPAGYNRRTVEAYENYAQRYAEATAPDPSGPLGSEGLRRLADVAGPDGSVLEVGSGPGWDTDYMESLGVAVRRTEVTRAFLDVQAERGRRAELLDVISDDLGGPYDGVMALCVLLHIERDTTDAVLRKVSDALRPGGGFLVSVREGAGEHWEGGTGAYRVVLRDEDEFTSRLAAAGLRVDWSRRDVDSEGRWLTFLTRKSS